MVMKFLKNNLKMSEYDKNIIEVIQIYANKSDEPDIIYLKCETPQDTSLVTKNAKNLPQGPKTFNCHPHTPLPVQKVPKQ